MSLAYKFDQQTHVLRLAGTFPTSVEDVQRIVPELIREIREFGNVKLLVEMTGTRLDGPDKAPDVGMQFLNDVKGDVVKLAIVCRDDMPGALSEMVQIARNHVCPARHFESIDEAQSWLLSK